MADKAISAVTLSAVPAGDANQKSTAKRENNVLLLLLLGGAVLAMTILTSPVGQFQYSDVFAKQQTTKSTSNNNGTVLPQNWSSRNISASDDGRAENGNHTTATTTTGTASTNIPPTPYKTTTTTSLRNEPKSSTKEIITTTMDACLSRNSQEWLQSDRLGNIDLSREEWIKLYNMSSTPLLSHIDELISQTLAWPNSILANSIQDIHNHSTEKAQRRWLTRLSYAIIYHHQNSPARSEWQQQQSFKEECMEHRQSQGLGRWDWECPDQKYIFFSLADQGLGAGADLFYQALFAGIASQRIVLPINHVGAIGKAWTMASCQRRDVQCVFAPTSPCVLTRNEIQNSTYLQTKGAFFHLFRKGVSQPPEYNNSIKVFRQGYNNFGLKSTANHEIFFQRVSQLAQELLEELSSTAVDDKNAATTSSSSSSREVWKRTAALYRTNRPMALQCLRIAATLYITRPNPSTRKRLQQILDRNLPKENYRPQETIGLPIRASDKCKKESTCLSFEAYMELALETQKQILPQSSNPPHVIVTSEAPEIYKKLRNLIKDPSEMSRYPLRFVLNDGDVQPGSGRFRASGNVTADDGMIAALSTIQLQLGSGIVRANCCSKFHRLMGDFLSVGAGGANGTVDFQCLSDMVDPRFRICCWQAGHCVNKRNKDLEAWKEQHGRA